MTESLITYGIVVILAILVIFSFMIGINKMIKIILGNYILSSICLAASQSITLAIQYLNQNPSLQTLGIANEKFSNFLENGSMIIVFVVYITLLVIMYRTSKIRIKLPNDEALKKMLQLIFVPLTIVSMILTLQIVLLGINWTNITSITKIAEIVTNNPYMFKFMSLTPVRILLHGLITIIITSELKVKVETDL